MPQAHAALARRAGARAPAGVPARRACAPRPGGAGRPRARRRAASDPAGRARRLAATPPARPPAAHRPRHGWRASRSRAVTGTELLPSRNAQYASIRKERRPPIIVTSVVLVLF